jgi:hypothetical protein
MRVLRDAVSSPEGPAAGQSTPPAYADLDAISRARLRRLAEQYLDATPALELHLDLVDARGAWYAEHVITRWRPDRPDAFWALVGHYVRTHMPDHGTKLDLARWVAAGIPEDAAIHERWEDVATTFSPDAVASAGSVDRESVPYMDDLIAAWPEHLWNHFWHTYVHTTTIFECANLPLPAVTD